VAPLSACHKVPVETLPIQHLSWGPLLVIPLALLFFPFFSRFFLNLRVFIKDQPQQEDQETMRLKDTELAAIKLPRCLVVRGSKVEWGGH